MADFRHDTGLTDRQRADILPLFKRVYHTTYGGPGLLGRQCSVHDPDSCTDPRGPCTWAEAVELRSIIKQLEHGPVVTIRLAALARGERVNLAGLLERVARLAAAEFDAGAVYEAADALHREFAKLIPSDPARRAAESWRLAAERARVRGTGLAQREQAREKAYKEFLEREPAAGEWLEEAAV